jgi:HAD superfamily hydrolase (TIGR01549 family)
MGNDARGDAGVIFDVDGTLLDTNYLHAVAWARAFRDAGHNPPMSRLHRAIGLTSDVLVEHLLGEEDEQVAEGHSTHYEAFKDDVRAFPRVPDLVDECRRRGLRIALATSGGKGDLEWMLPALGLEEDQLDGVLTSGDVDESKPSPDPFTTALDKVGLDPDRTVVVGDTVWDVEGAHRAGLRCIALTCGGIDEHTLREAGAEDVYDDPAALLDALDDSPVGLLSRDGG